MENIGGRKQWQIQLFGLFEAENFGDWLSIHQIHHCFLSPSFSTIQYMKCLVVV